jgi:hypothetical protein
MGTIAKERLLEFRGDDLTDQDGAKIGTIDEIYLDADSGEPEWALVTTGLFGNKRTFIPLAEASEEDGSLRVPIAKDTVKEAPQIDATGQLTKDEEANLYAHYGMEMPDPPEG